MTSRTLRHGAALLGFLFALTLAWATPVKFDIPSQSTASAIKAFIKQSKAQVTYRASELEGKTSREVKGEFENAAALNQLLYGTEFSAQQRDSGIFVVTVAGNNPGSIEGSIRDESGKPVAGAKVAIADSDNAVATDKRGRFLISGVAAGTYVLQVTAEGLQNARVTDVTVNAGRELSMSPITIPVRKQGTLELETYSVSAKKNDGVVELDPYAVSGQKAKAFSTANIDLQRSRDDVLPFTTFTAVEIERSGSANLEDFFRSRIPQNFSSGISEERNGNMTVFNESGNDANFRGWGASDMVILLNGRRMPAQLIGSSGAFATTGYFRGIPLGAIERVEVLSSAGSAIYGEGATGGVINVVTRRDWTGGHVSLRYENALDAHAPKRSVSLSYARPLGHALTFRFSADLSDSQPLDVEDRADVTIARWRREVVAREPDRITSASFPPVSPTPNIRSNIGNALFGPGSPSFTSVPDGYAGGQGLAPFLTRQGIYNYEMSPGMGIGSGSSSAAGLQSGLGTKNRDRSINLGFDMAIGSNWRWSVDYLTSDAVISGRGSVTNSTFSVPANAPTNPFGQTVFVTFDDPRFARPEQRRELRSFSNSVTTSLTGSLRSWRVLADFSLVADENRGAQDIFSQALVNGVPTTLSAAFAAGLYNPFVDMRTTAPAAPSFYEEYVLGATKNGSASQTLNSTLKASGAVWDLPAGEIIFTAGLEWIRTDRYRSFQITQNLNNRTRQEVSSPSISRYPQGVFLFDTYSVYAETTVPVIAAKQNFRFVREFEVFGSGRLSRQERVGFDFQGRPVTYSAEPRLTAYGLKFTPVTGVTLRLSQSAGFKPAGLDQVAPSLPPTVSTTVIDRRTNQSIVLSPTQYITGGNADLTAEFTESRNLGLIASPTQLPGFRLSIDYVESVRENAVTFLGVQAVLDLESTDPQLAARVQRSSSGAITFVDARNMNFREISSRSLDLTLSQRFENVFGGQLTITAAGSQNLSFKVQSSAAAAALEQVRNPSAIFSQALRWNANGQIQWENRQWTLGWDARFYDSILANPADIVAQGSDRAPWGIEHGMFVGYRIPRFSGHRFLQAMLEDTSVTVGVRNVFDRSPRYWAANPNFGYLSFDSVYGRSAWIQVRRNF